jgi:hypothetical protein
MIRDISNFVVELSNRFRVPLCLHYYPAAYQGGRFNIFSISIHGKYLLNFTNKNFYDIPKAERLKQIIPLLKVGLSHNCLLYTSPSPRD